MDEIYPWEKLDDSSSESVFLSQQRRFMTSIRDFVGERHSNFYSNTLEFFPLTYGEPLRIEIFSGSKDVIFLRFFEWVRNSKPTKASFFQKWLRERLLRYFSFQAIFEDGASEQFVATGRSQKCWEWTTQMIFLQRAEHPYFHTVDGSEIWRSPPGYEAFIITYNLRINYQAQLTSRISEPSNLITWFHASGGAISSPTRVTRRNGQFDWSRNCRLLWEWVYNGQLFSNKFLLPSVIG